VDGQGDAKGETLLGGATDEHATQRMELWRAERMKPDEIGALVRAVAYLNIADRRLLHSATTALLKRAAASKKDSEEWHEGTGAGLRMGDGVDKRILPQIVANIAWAAAVMGDVEASVHTWLAAHLLGPSLKLLSAEQVCWGVGVGWGGGGVGGWVLGRCHRPVLRQPQ
jgi:hypothetical protein